MKTESFGPREPEQELLHTGISAQDIRRIQGDTKAVRLAREEYPSAPDFLGDLLYSGDYQFKLQEGLHYTSPYITVTRELRKRFSRQTKMSEEVCEIQPIPDIAQEIAGYAKEVAERSDAPVQIVDFGAGAATTMLQASQLLTDEIATGKVNIIATNIDAAPPRQEQPIRFVTADILELYRLMQGSPIHLLFMVDTFPFTNEYNDYLLKIAGEILHPEYGTAVFGYGTVTGRNVSPLLTRPDLSSLTVIESGLDSLRQKGFTSANPIKKAPDVISLQQPEQAFPFDVYQGSKAPPFYLYTV